jgi:hypothetical protein
MTFDDVVHRLTHACGAHIEVSIALSPAGDEGRAVVARFEGTLEDLLEGPVRPDELILRVRLDATHKGPRGTVTLHRGTFQRAEEAEDCEPATLTLWERGAKISLDLYDPPIGPDNTRGA